MEAPGPLRGAQPSVDLQALLAGIFDNMLSDFIQLSSDSPGQADRESAEQRKHRLLQHLHGTRQQLLRALALLNWKPWKVLNELVDHDRVLDIAASHVRTMTEVVQQMRQQAAGKIMAGAYLNSYDVNTALEVLTTGTYQELPSIILQRPPLFQPPPASPARQRARLAHVTHLIRMRLVQVALPPGLKVVSISNGTAVLQAEGLYEAKLTLVPSEALIGVDPPNSSGAAAVGGGGGEAGGSGGGPGYDWTAAGTAAAGDTVAAAAASQRWKWRLIHFVLAIGVPFYDPRQPGQILNTCNFHMVLAADNAAYLRRQRQGAAGGAAAAGAAASTLSESAATPAASGLQLPGSAASTPAAAGGSLASAIRRAEDDEVGAPLAVMHAILTDVAGRLLADELAAAARALAAPGSRWHGHIAVKPSQLLHPGVRIEYWTQAPPLLRYCVLPPGEDWRSVKPGPPYLELGMGEGGCVEVLNSPSSLHKPISVSKLRLDTFRMNVEEVLMRAANMSSQFQLLQIRSELRVHLVEAMAIRVGTMRLSSIARQLWCRHGPGLAQPGTEEDEPTEAADAQPTSQSQQQQQPTTTITAMANTRDGAEAAAAAGALSSANDAGSAAPMDVDSAPSVAAPAASQPHSTAILPPTAPPLEVSGLLARAAPEEEVAGALVVLAAPVLEYLVSGTTELKIGKHLFNGRLTLRPGQDERDEGSLDHAATIAMNEDYVNQAALAAYNSTATDSYPAWRALKEACMALCHVLQRTHTSTDATHFIQAARRAALHISRLPHGMLEAFNATSPGLAIEPRAREKVATWALQCVPFPPNFPPLEPVGPDTLPLRVPQSLTFFLQSRLSLTSPHVLVVCSCNKQLMPIKVLSCIPVPASTYLLPEHVVAAFMAVSSAGHGHNNTGGGRGAGGAGGAAGAHSPAHSPRATLNGHEAGGLSPEASPLRDSTGATGMAVSHLRMTAGGGAASAVPSGPVPASEVAGGGGGGAAGQASGMPSLPPAASPPHSHSYSYSHGRVPSTGTAASGAHPPRSSGVIAGGGGGGCAAVASGGGASGRATGQQVAVMLAQQQLSSVVRWCRRRMVWEVLLVQLKAVGTAFVELCNPPCQRVRITAVAGTALPCHIGRRRGLSPPRVGPTCLELELGPDPLAGQVTARLYGRFLCSPSCTPRDPSSGGGGGSRRPSAAAATAGFWLDEQATAAHRSGARGGGESGIVCLRRQYCLERGDSALTLVQEVSAVIRMQTLLARLEMTARPIATPTSAGARRVVQAQRLAVLAPPPPADLAGQADSAADVPGRMQHWTQHHAPQKPQQQQQQVGTCAFKAGGGEMVGGPTPGVYGSGGGGAGYHALQPAAKRIKMEPGSNNSYGNGGWSVWQQEQQQQQEPQPGLTYGHPTGLANGAAEGRHWLGGSAQVPGGGGGSGSGGATAAAPPLLPSVLTWHWPLVGTLTLEEYSCSAATLRVTPCTAGPCHSATDTGTAAAAAMPPPPLLLYTTWAPRDVRDPQGGGGGSGVSGGATPGTGTPAPTPGGVIAVPTAVSPAVGGVVPSPLAATPPPAQQQQPYPSGPLLPDGMRPSRQGPTRSPAESFGSLFSDLVLCSISCSSGHPLPADYLQVLEELAEAGEEGKLLDAVVVAAWPVAAFCASLRTSVLSRHGLLPELDVRLTMQQPPYCLRIVCRKRGAGGGAGSAVLIDLICLAVGRSYIKVSAPLTSSQQQQQLQAQQGLNPDADASPSHAILSYVQQLALTRLADRGVHVSVGGRAAVYAGLGQRPAAVPGPGAPLWLLVPPDCVQQAVELVFSALA